MKTDFLKGLGLDQTVIDQIMAENGKDIAAEQAKTATAEEKLVKANETLSGLRETVKKFDGKDPEKLEQDLTALQKKYNEDTNAIKDAYEKKLSDAVVEAAIERALAGSQAKHPDLLTGKFDREKITVKDGHVTGVEEQLKEFRSTYKDLFEEKLSGREPANPDVNGLIGGNTYEAIVANAENMTAEQVAEQFSALNK